MWLKFFPTEKNDKKQKAYDPRIPQERTESSSAKIISTWTPMQQHVRMWQNSRQQWFPVQSSHVIRFLTKIISTWTHQHVRMWQNSRQRWFPVQSSHVIRFLTESWEIKLYLWFSTREFPFPPTKGNHHETHPQEEISPQESSGAVWTGRWAWPLISYPILPPSLISHTVSVNISTMKERRRHYIFSKSTIPHTEDPPLIAENPKRATGKFWSCFWNVLPKTD